MKSARFCLFKIADGALVGAIGGTLVNAAAMFMGVEGVDTGKVAIIMAFGSLVYGVCRGEVRTCEEAGHTTKYFKAEGARRNHHNSRFIKFAATTKQNGTGNAISAGIGVIPYVALAITGATDPSFRTLAELLLCVTAGSAVEYTYQPHVARIRL